MSRLDENIKPVLILTLKVRNCVSLLDHPGVLPGNVKVRVSLTFPELTQDFPAFPELTRLTPAFPCYNP